MLMTRRGECGNMNALHTVYLKGVILCLIAQIAARSTTTAQSSAPPATTGEAAQSNAQQNAAYTTPTQPAQQPVQTDNSKTMAILAVVFPILFFLPIVTNPKTEFGTFWANQALLLLLLSVVASITAGIVIGILIWVFQVVLWIMALVSVCKGEMKRLPLIGTIDIIK